jgi:hypothetical protein
MSNYLLISGICLASLLLIFFYFKWYINRSLKGLLSEYRDEVYRMIADIDAATDRDSRLVEDRIVKLKTILDEADKRVSVYTKEFERSRSGEVLYTSLGRGIRAALNTVEPVNIEKKPAAKDKAPEHIRTQIEQLYEQNLAPVEIASRLKISQSEVDLALTLIKKTTVSPS